MEHNLSDDDLRKVRKDAEDFLKAKGVYLDNEPSVHVKGGYYEDIRDLLALFAYLVIEESSING